MAPSPTDDDLEPYALEHLPECAAAATEEHLLVCGRCQKRLADWDEYVGAMVAASTTLRFGFRRRLMEDCGENEQHPYDRDSGPGR
jgi:anti-sigma factor RsiW